MYCRFCGKEIDADSIFCTHCGKNLAATGSEKQVEATNAPSAESTADTGTEAASVSVSTSTAQSVNTPSNQNKAESSGGSSLWGCWLALPIFLIIFVICAIGIASTMDGGGIGARDLKSSDYTYTTSQDLTSYRITVVPNRNIKNCDIELNLYNSKGDLIFSDTISKTDLKKNNAYTYTFDFGFVNSLSGSNVKFSITGRCK